MMGIGHKTVGHRAQDTGHRTQDTGHKTQDIETLGPVFATGNALSLHPSLLQDWVAKDSE